MHLDRSSVQRDVVVSEGSALVQPLLDDSTPPPTSTAIDQRVIELSTQVEAMKEKCTRYDALEAQVQLMQRMLTRLCPSFPSMSMVRGDRSDDGSGFGGGGRASGGGDSTLRTSDGGEQSEEGTKSVY
nr:hypothetical protein CFP56_57796 [Quercus suber]